VLKDGGDQWIARGDGKTETNGMCTLRSLRPARNSGGDARRNREGETLRRAATLLHGDGDGDGDSDGDGDGDGEQREKTLFSFLFFFFFFFFFFKTSKTMQVKFVLLLLLLLLPSSVLFKYNCLMISLCVRTGA
jgi:hypothetical protein